MATSSFTKTFVLDAEATKRFLEAQERPGVCVEGSSPDRLKEGKELLAQFFSRLKK